MVNPIRLILLMLFPTVTYTASTNTPVTEGFPNRIYYRSNASKTVVRMKMLRLQLRALLRVGSPMVLFAITAAEFTSGSGTVTKNYSVISDPVYQGDEKCHHRCGW